MFWYIEDQDKRIGMVASRGDRAGASTGLPAGKSTFEYDINS
jgi:hypothetical protein